MRIGSEHGAALVIAMMAMLLMTALGIAVILTTSGETIVAHNYRNSSEARYAADAGIERVMADLLPTTDWSPLLDGSTRSSFVDGAPSGSRTLVDGTQIDLGQIVNLATCDQTAACTDAQIESARPWGANNPRWRLYAYDRLADVLPPGASSSPYYVVVLVADDPSEVDGDPLHDGVVPCDDEPPIQDDKGTWNCNPGTGVVWLRAESFGPRGAHTVIEVTVARAGAAVVERGGEAQIGAGEQSRSAQRIDGETDTSKGGGGQVRLVSWRELR